MPPTDPTTHRKLTAVTTILLREFPATGRRYQAVKLTNPYTAPNTLLTPSNLSPPKWVSSRRGLEPPPAHGTIFDVGSGLTREGRTGLFKLMFSMLDAGSSGSVPRRELENFVRRLRPDLTEVREREEQPLEKSRASIILAFLLA